MANVQLTLTISPRWWFRPAFYIAMMALRLGLVRDAENAEYVGGKITADERVAKWLTDYAFRFGVR